VCVSVPNRTSVALGWLHDSILGVTVVNTNGNITHWSPSLQINPDDAKILPYIKGTHVHPIPLE
jgi:hypothetical protein